MLHLAVPPRSAQPIDSSATGAALSRYGTVERRLRDETISEDEYPVTLGRKNLALLSSAQLQPGLISFPVARIMRDGRGGFISDAAFLPPLLRIGVVEDFLLRLKRLADTIEEKITTTRRGKRANTGFESGTSALDVANYWFLHALCTALPALRQQLVSRAGHPEELYSILAELAGSLCTFALDSNPATLPMYDHLHLNQVFTELENHIQRHLEIVVPSNTVTFEFRRLDQNIHVARVLDERCLRRSRWILGIRSDVAESTVMRMTPNLVKICSAEGAIKLVQRALPGLELVHLPVPPSALSAQADMHLLQHRSCRTLLATYTGSAQRRRLPARGARQRVLRSHGHHRGKLMTPNEVLPRLRSNSLAMSFQDVLTVILRVRYRVQRVADVAGFRDSIRKMIAAATQEARRLGYSDKTAQMALYAIVGFLDESILNSQDPTFQDWARRPLQEEMFGGHFAGEYFFRNVDDLLNQQESPEVADTLELLALCLLLGFRGRYAAADHGEIQNILRRIREKITRIRGQLLLTPVRSAPPVVSVASGDPWIKRLVLATALMVLLVVVAFAAYTFLLHTGLEGVRAQFQFSPPIHQLAQHPALAGGLAS